MNGLTCVAQCAGRIGAIVVAVFLALMIQINGAHAGNCLAAASSTSPEISRLQRQIAANRAMESKYSCVASASFACREIAGRIAQVSARLARLSAASQPSCQKPVVAERAVARRFATVREATPALPRMSARIETRCVRLSDGYSFPTPNSGYNTAKDVQTITAQCKFICEDPQMDVYRMTGADWNTDEMISVTTGARYAELPNAGAYRKASPLKTCDINRFYKTVLAKTPAAAAAADPVDLNVEVGQSVEAAVMDVALLGDVGLRGTTSFVPAPPRKIRIVGAAFLPEE